MPVLVDRGPIGLAGFLVGVTLLGSGCATLPPDAVRRIQTADADYQAERYSQAVRKLNVVIANYPKTRGVGEAYYLRGLCNLQTQSEHQARVDFESALATAKRPALVARVEAQLGHLSYLQGDYARAVQYYASALPNLPDQPPKDEILYREGDSQQKCGRWKQARQVLPKIWHLFPNSEFVPYARRKFTWPHDYFTIQCGAFSRSDLAHAMANDLRMHKFDAVATVNPMLEATPHVVYVGSYTAYTEAEQQLARVRQQVAEAFIVP